MSVIQTIEADGQKALTALQHAAAWLVGAIASSEQSLATIEKDDPLVAEAIAAGEAAAASHGIPVAAIQVAAEDVIAVAKQVAAGLTSTSAPPATAVSSTSGAPTA